MNFPLSATVSACFSGKRVLVTGAAGYLAFKLIESLKSADCAIVRWARTGREVAPVQGRAGIEDLAGDVRVRASWEQVLPKVDVVFHCAAATSSSAAEEAPGENLMDNVLPLVHLLEVCRLQRLQPVVVFASTVTVVGNPTVLPVDEDYRGDPTTVYDLHKRMAEDYLKVYVARGQARGTILRLANVYGPGPPSSRPDRGILNQMIRWALAGQPLTVYGSGAPLRDYIYVDDVAAAFLAAVPNIDRLNGRHFIIGTGQGHSIAEAFNLVADRATVKIGKRVPVQHVEPPVPQAPIELRNFVADSRRFSQATGWQARVPFSEGIDRTIEALS